MENREKFLKEIEPYKKAYLANSFALLNRLSKWESYRIRSDYSPLNNRPIKIRRISRCFEFMVDDFNMVKDMVKYQSIGYGLGRPFKLISNNKLKLEFPSGASSFSIRLKDSPYNINGTVNEVTSFDFENDNTCFIRCIIPLPTSVEPPNTYIENVRFTIDEKILLHGLIEIKVNNTLYWIYSTKNNNEGKLIIESKEKTDLSKFFPAYDSIIYSLSLISGFLARDEVFIIKAQSQDFLESESFYLKKQLNSIDSLMEIISPTLVIQTGVHEKINRFLPKETFESLVNLLTSNETFFRSVSILTQSNKLPKELQASSYCVSLETVKNAILENDKEIVNPIKKPSPTLRVIM